MEIEEEGHLPFLDIDIYRKLKAPSDTEYIGNPPIPTPTYTKIPITMHPTSTQSSRPWYIDQQLYATKNL